MEIKQNQTFLIGTYSNLTSSVNGRKIIKNSNGFYNFNSIAKVSTNKKNEIKANGTCAMYYGISLFTKYYGISMTFEIYFVTIKIITVP